MTCRRDYVRVAGAVLAAVIATGACGCGSSDQHPPRRAMSSFLGALVAGNVTSVCRSATPAAMQELGRDFGGHGCRRIAAATVRYVDHSPGERRALAGSQILSTVDVPLAPAPYRSGASTAALRVLIDDPVLERKQAVDVTLRKTNGEWRVDAGVAGLFTVLATP